MTGSSDVSRPATAYMISSTQRPRNNRCQCSRDQTDRRRSATAASMSVTPSSTRLSDYVTQQWGVPSNNGSSAAVLGKHSHIRCVDVIVGKHTY
ncbi:hypothetical protein J6590_044337 [Homalodisca vitripennis]|nr:hypothetical protein J6590_044337 [Homalodisca vitripennis]